MKSSRPFVFVRARAWLAVEILLSAQKGEDGEAAALAEYFLKRLKGAIADPEQKATIEDTRHLHDDY